MNKGQAKRIRTPKEIEQIFNVMRVILAIVIALLFAFAVILMISDEPVEAISSFVVGPFTTLRRFGEIISKMIPLLFTGAAVCFIFSANQTNMAVEGGFTVGALGATIVAVYFHVGNSVIHIALCCLLGGLFGMMACFVPAFMYVKFDSKPIVSSLMMNYVCMYIAIGLINHSMRDNTAGFNASATFDDTAILPKLIPGTPIHFGLIIAIVVIIFSYFYLYRSKNGYEIRVIGKNSGFATYCGMPVKRTIMKSQLIGGFLRVAPVPLGNEARAVAAQPLDDDRRAAPELINERPVTNLFEHFARLEGHDAHPAAETVGAGAAAKFDEIVHD